MLAAPAEVTWASASGTTAAVTAAPMTALSIRFLILSGSLHRWTGLLDRHDLF
jgi:hypothetical protein